jgi:hypothetical protein
MSRPRVGILSSTDRQAIFDAAKRLRLDPYELGGFLSLESGPNMDPNIRGGAGGNYYGMIQFGPAERKKYLDPEKIGKYTRAEQMPKVVQFLLDRGFKPGQMKIDRAYATVLKGNPNASLTSKDSFGTSVSSALPRFKKGGDLYENARRVLGDLPTAAPPPPTLPAPQVTGPVEKGNERGRGLLRTVMDAMKFLPMTGTIPPLSTLEIPPMDGQSFLNAYRMFFDDDEGFA